MTSADSRFQVGGVRVFAVRLLLVLSFLCCNQIASASEDDLRIDVEIGPVNTVKGEGGALWVGTKKGLFIWDDTSQGVPRQVLADTGAVYDILQDGNTWLIGAERGLFHWDNPSQGGIPQAIPDSPDSVKKLYKFGTRLFIGAIGGLFIWQSGNPDALTHFDVAVSSVNVFCLAGDNRLWIGSERGLFSWDSEKNEPVPVWVGEEVKVTSIENEGSTLLVGTSRGLLRWIDAPAGRREWVFSDDEVHALYKDGPALLISTTDKGLFRWGNVLDGRPELIDSRIGTSSSYCRTGSVLWMGAGLAAEAGLYRWDLRKGGKPQRVAAVNTGAVRDLYSDGRTLWVGAAKGLFQIGGLDAEWDAKLQITPQPPKRIYAGQNLLVKWQVGDFGWRAVPSQVPYRVIVKDEGGQEVQPGGWEVFGRQEFTLPTLPEGKYYLYIQATDINGKTATSPPREFSVRPFWKDTLFGGLLLGVGCCALILIAVILAPSSTFCHDLLMNPWVRKLGSFGLIPIALTVLPQARRHILKRYQRAVMSGEEFSEWQTKFIVPAEDFLPEAHGTLLSKKRKVQLLGQAGIGKTSYFKYLTGCYARGSDIPPVGAIPVFIPLFRYQGEPPENMFSAQLANYGRLIDKELNISFLQRGGFVIFIDGLNEIDESTRNKINTFIDQHWKANYFCISSQQAYPEFAGIACVQLAALDEDKIKEFLRQRLGDEQAQAIIKQFHGNISDIYKIPHDLEFAVEFKKRHPDSPLPNSKMELYEASLSPILNAWVEEGRTDYPDLLFRRAYEMLRSREAFFDNSGTPLPDDLRGSLVDKKYLIRRGDRYLFRHDLVRSYLASKYLGGRWKNLLSEEGLEIDVNWRPMLEFFLLSLKQPDEAREVLELILIKNKGLAGELFSWLVETTPDLCDRWIMDFKLKYASAMLKST